ncbi:MAG: ABC transporter substrate binding protein [Pseudomonadota bacterium]
MKWNALAMVAMCAAAHGARAADVSVVVSSRNGAFGQALAEIERELGRDRVQVFDLSSAARAQLADEILGAAPRVLITVGPIATRFAAKNLPQQPTIFCLTVAAARTGPGTGVPLEVSADEVFRHVRAAVPRARRLSAIYDPTESGAQVEVARAAAKRHGLELHLHPLANRQQASRTVSEALQDADAVWLLPDRSLSQRETLQYLLVQSMEKRVPVITSFEAVARQGALLAVVPDPVEHGRAAARMARAMLDGAAADKVAAPAVATRTLVNLRTAERIGIKIPDAVLAEAHAVIR